MSLAEVNEQRALAYHTRIAEEDDWEVAAAEIAGATTFTVRKHSNAAVVPNVRPGIAVQYAGAKVEFTSGANLGVSAKVLSVASVAGPPVVTTINLVATDALPGALAAGDTLTVFRTETIEVTAPENIAEVGGVAQTGADWTLLLQAAAVKQGATTDRSGSITTGGISQQLAAANATRRYLLVQNPSTAASQGIGAAESLWVNFTAAATESEPSIEITPGATLILDVGFVSTEAVNVVAATVSHKFTAKEG